MSKTLARLCSSAGVSKSNRTVASPVSFRTSATYRLRGLCLLLPLPCAKTTIPVDCFGIVRCPATDTGPATTSTSSSRIGGAATGEDVPKSPAGSIEQSDYLVVGGLSEVAVALPDGGKELRGGQAHHLVGVLGDGLDGFGCADGNRQRHRAGALGAGDLARRLNGRTGRDAVIDDHGGSRRQRYPVAAPAEVFGAALQFGPLLVLDRVHVVAAEARVTHDGVVDHPHPALTNRAEGQFGLKRHSELAHDNDVERDPYCLGDLKGHHRYPASR